MGVNRLVDKPLALNPDENTVFLTVQTEQTAEVVRKMNKNQVIAWLKNECNIPVLDTLSLAPQSTVELSLDVSSKGLLIAISDDPGCMALSMIARPETDAPVVATVYDGEEVSVSAYDQTGILVSNGSIDKAVMLAIVNLTPEVSFLEVVDNE